MDARPASASGPASMDMSGQMESLEALLARMRDESGALGARVENLEKEVIGCFP